MTDVSGIHLDPIHGGAVLGQFIVQFADQQPPSI